MAVHEERGSRKQARRHSQGLSGIELVISPSRCRVAEGFMKVILQNFELPGAGMAPGIGRFRWEAGDFRKEKLRLPRRGTGLAARVLGRQSFPQAGNGQTTLTEKIHKHRIATT